MRDSSLCDIIRHFPDDQREKRNPNADDKEERSEGENREGVLPLNDVNDWFPIQVASYPLLSVRLHHIWATLLSHLSFTDCSIIMIAVEKGIRCRKRELATTLFKSSASHQQHHNHHHHHRMPASFNTSCSCWSEDIFPLTNLSISCSPNIPLTEIFQQQENLFPPVCWQLFTWKKELKMKKLQNTIQSSQGETFTMLSAGNSITTRRQKTFDMKWIEFCSQMSSISISHVCMKKRVLMYEYMAGEGWETSQHH